MVCACDVVKTLGPPPYPPSLQFTGRDTASLVISFAQKTLKEGQIISKLHVIELGSTAREPGGRGGRAGGAHPHPPRLSTAAMPKHSGT